MIEKPIPGHFGYSAREDGAIISRKHGIRRLKPSINSAGRAFVSLCTQGQKKTYSVQSLVAAAYSEAV